MLDKPPIGGELSCLSSISCSDLDQLPRGETESRNESEIRKEGNRTETCPTIPRRRKERGKNDKGKKRERRKYGKPGTTEQCIPPPGEEERKTKERGKKERRGQIRTEQSPITPRARKEREKERKKKEERKKEKGKKESRKHGHRTEQNQPPPGGERLKERKKETRKAGTAGTEQDRTVTPPGGRENEGNK